MERPDLAVTLRRSIARETLAQAIYDTRAIEHAIEGPSWRSLSERLKNAYRGRADVVLDLVQPRASQMRPVQFVTGLRATHGPVIGAIVPAVSA